ncbi:hypothetical protein E4P42_24395 [Mycobacterium sp. PS03-16]|nr:hypothetical protein E4P42_24395 [Mycobacterium sp. PS03-16]
MGCGVWRAGVGGAAGAGEGGPIRAGGAGSAGGALGAGGLSAGVCTVIGCSGAESDVGNSAMVAAPTPPAVASTAKTIRAARMRTSVWRRDGPAVSPG